MTVKKEAWGKSEKQSQGLGGGICSYLSHDVFIPGNPMGTGVELFEGRWKESPGNRINQMPCPYPQ